LIKYGEIFGLLGPNGSGKTTTINIVSGLSKPTSRQVKVLGHDILKDTRGVVPQETALYEELSAWTNMSLHADLYGVGGPNRDSRINEMLNLVQLYDLRLSRVSTFSGGMKRRLALARALLHHPQLLYLDEPTLGVDVQSRRAIWDYILDLKKKGKTILLTTNYLEEAKRQALAKALTESSFKRPCLWAICVKSFLRKTEVCFTLQCSIFKVNEQPKFGYLFA
jgi:ABC-2 type transport system ATP-binding protein